MGTYWIGNEVIQCALCLKNQFLLGTRIGRFELSQKKDSTELKNPQKRLDLLDQKEKRVTKCFKLKIQMRRIQV